tara:strand:- start:653 stop:877 length:225 start_codon:yes stop_codon:yes gene_type:complete
MKVKSIRYFTTRKGMGYECMTSIPGVKIWNDGDGGTTYVESFIKLDRQSWEWTDTELEDLINEYEDAKELLTKN